MVQAVQIPLFGSPTSWDLPTKVKNFRGQSVGTFVSKCSLLLVKIARSPSQLTINILYNNAVLKRTSVLELFIACRASTLVSSTACTRSFRVEHS